MVLAFNARPATRDVDAIFEPADLIREAAAVVQRELLDQFRLERRVAMLADEPARLSTRRHCWPRVRRYPLPGDERQRRKTRSTNQ